METTADAWPLVDTADTNPHSCTLSTRKRSLRGGEVGPTAPRRANTESRRQCGGQTAMSLKLFLESRGSASARPGSVLCCFSRVGHRRPLPKVRAPSLGLCELSWWPAFKCQGGVR